MRVRDLLPETEYATCDGTLVVTGKTVESGWYEFQEAVVQNGENVRVTKIEHGDPRQDHKRGKVDPWAKCSPSHRSGITIHCGPGIRVTQYGYDRQGKRLVGGIQRTYVIKPGDLPGLWSDYLLLHAEDIEDKFLMKDLEDEARAWRTDMRETLARVGIPVDDGSAPSSRAIREGRAYVSATVQRQQDYKGGRYVRTGPPVIHRSIELPGDQATRVVDLLREHAPVAEG